MGVSGNDEAARIWERGLRSSDVALRSTTAACTVFALLSGFVASLTVERAAPADAARVEFRDAGSERVSTRRERSRAAAPAPPDEVPTDASPSPAPPVATWAEHSVADLALLSVVEWASSPDPRPSMTDEDRDAAWEELLSRGAAAIGGLLELALRGTGSFDDAAQRALVRMGPRAVPALLDLMRYEDPDARDLARVLLVGIARSSAGLGGHRHAVLAAAAAATDDLDPDAADAAEYLLSVIPGCLPTVADRLACGSESQRLSALRVLAGVADDANAPAACALLEATARNPHETQAVRDAAAFELARCGDVTAPVASMPDPKGLPDVRLWAAALAFDEDEPRADVLAALRDRREVATALFLDTALHAGDPWAVHIAIYALGAVHEDQVPLLLQVAAEAETAAARELAITRIEEHFQRAGSWAHLCDAREGVVERLLDPDADVRDATVSALAQMSASGADAVSALLPMLDDPAAAIAAAAALELIGSAAEGAAGRLTRVVHDPSSAPELRSAALDALVAISQDTAERIASAYLGSTSLEVRRSAASCLLRDDAFTHEARSVALACLTDQDASIRRLGAGYLRRRETRSADERVMAAAAAAIGDPDPHVRLALVEFLKDAWRVFPASCYGVLACLDDPDTQVQAAAMDARGTLAKCADRAVPILTKSLGDPDDDVVGRAATALGSLGDAARPAIPEMIDALFDRNGRPRPDVALGLAALGDDARSARPLLVACVRRGLDNARGDLTRALDDLEWTPTTSDVARLVTMVHGGDWDRDARMWSALRLLERAGTAAAAAVPDVLAAARESTKSRRSRLVNALGHVSLGEPEVLAFLTEALRSRDVYHGCAGWWDVPAAAAEALGRIGPPARETVPALLDAFRGDMRDEAAAALRAITGEDPVLTALPADRDE